MTPEKQKQKLAGQSSIAQKVFQFVPIESAWMPTEISAAMCRATSSRLDPKILMGCLMTLKDAGLVGMQPRGSFARLQVKAEKPEAIEIPQPAREKKEMTTPKPAQAKTPVDILSSLATRCRTLADDLDTAALEIDESMAAQSAGLEKLAQFQQILKSLNA